MTTIRTFFLQIRELFSNFWKRAGESPPLPPLVTRLLSYENLIGKKVNLFKYVKDLNLLEMDSRFLQVGNSEFRFKIHLRWFFLWILKFFLEHLFMDHLLTLLLVVQLLLLKNMFVRLVIYENELNHGTMIRIIVCIDCIIVSCLNQGYFFLFIAAYSSLKINQQASGGVIASSAILSISGSFKEKVGL